MITFIFSLNSSNFISMNQEKSYGHQRTQETKEVLGIFTEFVEISAKEINVQNCDEVKALTEWV